MASLVKWLKFSGAMNATGAPISSGTAKFTVPGSTSQAITVYADPAATQPLTQPVALDASGKATVYVPSSCEIIIYDALGAQQLLSTNAESVEAAQVNVTFNTVPNTLDTVLTQLETSIGQNASYWESGATGTVARTIHDALHTAVSPKDFGAVGNGSADDTVPLQRAINEAIAAKLSVRLDGLFKVTGSVTVSGICNIIGNGPERSAILCTTEGFDLIVVNTSAASTISGCTFRGFSATNIYTGALGYSGIRVTGGTGHVFENIDAQGSYGIRIDYGVTSSKIVGCTATTKTVGYLLASGVNAYDSKATCVTGIGFQSFGNSLIAGCYTTGGSTGFYVGGSSGTIDVVLRSYAYNATNSFVINSASAVLIGNDSTALTADVNNVAGYAYTDIANSWTSTQKPTNIVTNANANPSFTFDPSYRTNVFKLTYSGNATTCTIAWSVAPTVVGCEYVIVIQTSAATSTSGATTFPSQFSMVTPGIGTGLAAGCFFYAMFQWTGSKLMQTTAWAAGTTIGW